MKTDALPGRSHIETLLIHEPNFNHNYYTLALISLVEIVLFAANFNKCSLEVVSVSIQDRNLATHSRDLEWYEHQLLGGINMHPE